MSVKAYCAAVNGMEITPVTVEVSLRSGTFVHLSGLPDTSVKESLDRIRAALNDIGKNLPAKDITINLSPADLQKSGSGYDLPITIATLAADDEIPVEPLSQYMIMAELGLDGRLCSIRGALPIALKAKEKGFKGIILPEVNAAEAAVVDGIEVYDKNKDDVLGDKGSVSFNNATATLTLNGAYIDAAVNKANYGIETNGGDFNIKVLGTNYVNGGIIFNATGQNGDGLTMTIEGDAKAGNSKLYINQADYEGIYAYLSNVRIIDCELIIRNVGTGITMKASAKLGGNLDVENATVRINANESAMTGVYYLNLGKGISIIEPVGAVFAQGYGNILVDDKVQSSVLIGPEGTPTGISDIKTDGSKHTIYDLSGRALKQTKAAGIYVVDGRKVVIR